MTNLTAPQLIKKVIVERINQRNYDDYNQPVNTPEEVEAAYDLAIEKRIHWDFDSNIRSEGRETGLPAPFSRNYEVDIHAQKFGDEWVAYPYYYGGGKHGDPEGVPWIDDAFFVECQEEERIVTMRTFTKK